MGCSRVGDNGCKDAQDLRGRLDDLSESVNKETVSMTKLEGHGFDSRSGHMPALWVWSWCMFERWLVDGSLPLFPSLNK